MTEEETKQYNRIIEREKELKKKKREVRTGESDTEESDILNYRTYITGLLSGRVTDFEYVTSSTLVLEVNTPEGKIDVRVSDTGGYSEENELVRLLEWKGIEDGKVGDLLDTSLTLKSSEPILDRGKDVTEIDFNVYVPKRFDSVGQMYYRIDSLLRRLGLTNFEDVASVDSDLFMKLLGSMLIGCFGAIIFLMSVLLTIPILPLLGEYAILLPVIMTVLVGIEARVATDLYRRYKNFRSKDRIQNS